ncbi:hypothetical protein MKX01_024487 [Papaver californicum]|nr:hypothetical protein MKX01_024487 [Papaver californicum]
MSEAQDQLEIKFRLNDGSDIGPKIFSSATRKENGPRTVKDVKLISAGKILENSRTLEECKSPICGLTGEVTTMHVVVQPQHTQGEKRSSDQLQNRCVCVIL